jgi:hypothetical protein
VLALQAGRYWAERTEEGDNDEEYVILEADGSAEAPIPVLSHNGITLKRRRSRGKTPEIGLSEEKVKPLRVQAS